MPKRIFCDDTTLNYCLSINFITINVKLIFNQVFTVVYKSVTDKMIDLKIEENLSEQIAISKPLIKNNRLDCSRRGGREVRGERGYTL